MAERIYINQFQPNQMVEGVFTLQNCQLGLTRNGKPYLKCLLQDRTGRLPGRMWNASEELFEMLPTDGFVMISGQTQPYQGELQIIIQSIEAVQPSYAEMADLLPSTKHRVETMFDEVRTILGSMHSPSLRALAGAYLNDKELMRCFIQAPAAATLHHAFLGGLLEHTLQVLRLARLVMPLYPNLNHDLVLTGLFLHDLGKCAELSWDAGFAYTADGQLIGHVARGILWLQKKADQCEAEGKAVPEDALRVLHHIILSHHGQLEFGAMKYPSTPEAILVNHLDNLDAKMQMALDAANREGLTATELGGDFTEKVWALENVRLYRPDPLKNEQGETEPQADASDAATS